MRKIIHVGLLLTLAGSMLLAATDETTISITINNNNVDWANLQYPGTGAFQTADTFNVYAQVWEDGITNGAGQGGGIAAWIGYSDTDSDPSGAGWTWISATYHGDSGNNDEYVVDLGNTLTTGGTVYVASRFSMDSTTYVYGGFNSGFWDGTTNVNAAYDVTVNTAPVLAAIGAQALTEDTATYLVLSSSDAESDSVFYRVTGGSEGTVLATVSNDTLYLTPADDYFTSEDLSLTITAEDEHGATDSEAIAVSVSNVNDAPVIAAISDQTGNEGETLSFDVNATDVDGDDLSWSSANLPEGSSLTDNEDGSATFSWTPTYSQAGTYSDVQFIVNDGQGGEAVLRLAAGK